MMKHTMIKKYDDDDDDDDDDEDDDDEDDDSGIKQSSYKNLCNKTSKPYDISIGYHY